MSLPELVELMMDVVFENHPASTERHDQTKTLCADIYRLGLADGRAQAVKDYEGRLATAQRQVIELNQEIADLIRMDGER